MKKTRISSAVLALVLAFAMVLGTCTTAFASFFTEEEIAYVQGVAGDVRAEIEEVIDIAKNGTEAEKEAKVIEYIAAVKAALLEVGVEASKIAAVEAEIAEIIAIAESDTDVEAKVDAYVDYVKEALLEAGVEASKITSVEAKINEIIAIAESDVDVEAKVDAYVDYVEALLELTPEEVAEVDGIVEEVKAEVKEIIEIAKNEDDAAAKEKIDNYVAFLKEALDIDAEDEALIAELIADITALVEEIKGISAEDVKAVVDGYIAELKAQAELQIAKLGHKPYAVEEGTYVAIGGDTVGASNLIYGEKPYYAIVGEELLADTAIVLGSVEDNAVTIASADLITYQADASKFIYSILAGTPDWSKYIDAETMAVIDEVLAQVDAVLAKDWEAEGAVIAADVIAEIKAAVLENLPEEITVTEADVDNVINFCTPYIARALALAEAKKDAAVDAVLGLDADLVDYAEKAVYAVVAYAIDTIKAVEAIQAINPDATLVVVGMYNPVRGLEIATEDGKISAEEIFDYVIAATNLYYATYAAADKNFAFVDVSEAATNGFETVIDATALDINAVAMMLMNAGASMNANADGHAYIAEQILNSFKCNCAMTSLDDTYHGLVCVLCGTVYDKAAHKFDDDTDATCDVCGYVRDIAPEEDEEYYGGGGSVSNQFTIKFETNGGSAVASVKVKKGALLAEPKAPTKAGYVFAGWYTDKALTSKYDFSTPVNKAFVLYAKWVSESVAKFKDLDKDAWYYDYVAKIIEKGLMKGISETEFAPNATLTRGMFVTILHRVEGEPAVENAVNFADVAADQYYAKAVQWANANGIVKGISETEFAPNAEVTREQMAAMIARYAEYKKIAAAEGDVTYTDAESISDYAKDAVKAANKLGILIGNADGSFAPQRNSTRAEAATLFVRLLDVLKK